MMHQCTLATTGYGRKKFNFEMIMQSNRPEKWKWNINVLKLSSFSQTSQALHQE